MNWDDELIYHSLNNENSSFTLSFFEPFYIEEFMLKTGRNRDPRYWILEGSEDGVTYVQLHKSNGDSLCGDWKALDAKGTKGCTEFTSKTFSADNPGFYTSARFRMFGKSSNDDDYLVLAAIDFIGHVKIRINTCKGEKKMMNMVFIVAFFIC